jgi:hypothetical protein
LGCRTLIGAVKPFRGAHGSSLTFELRPIKVHLIDRIARAVSEMVAAHPMLGLEVTDTARSPSGARRRASAARRGQKLN